MFKHVDIISDPICPWCYIGKKRFERALEKQHIINPTIRWRAFQLNPEMPTIGMDREEYLINKFGSIEKASSLYKNIFDEGQKEEINFNFDKIHITPNTFQAHRLIHFASNYGLQNKIVDDLFKSYFCKGEDIGSIEILIKISMKNGIPQKLAGDLLKGKEQIENVNLELSSARKMGVNGVPVFIFNSKEIVSGAQETEIFNNVLKNLNKPASLDT